METNLVFDSNRMEDSLTRLYESGKFTYRQFDRQSKRLLETTRAIKQEETKQKLAEEETKQKLAEEETKQKTLEYETKQLVSNNNVKNIDNVGKAVIKWGDVLGPIVSFMISFFDNNRIIQDQTNKNPINVR